MSYRDVNDEMLRQYCDSMTFNTASCLYAAQCFNRHQIILGRHLFNILFLAYIYELTPNAVRHHGEEKEEE
jgi:hypothetical protein